MKLLCSPAAVLSCRISSKSFSSNFSKNCSQESPEACRHCDSAREETRGAGYPAPYPGVCWPPRPASPFAPRPTCESRHGLASSLIAPSDKLLLLRWSALERAWMSTNPIRFRRADCSPSENRTTNRLRSQHRLRRRQRIPATKGPRAAQAGLPPYSTAQLEQCAYT